MTSCMQNPPLAFRAGGACGGNGVCVNSTRTPGLLLCRCNAFYSGASDFFDNRVERLPDGTVLSMGCQYSQAGAIVVWIFFTLCGLKRVIDLAPRFITTFRAYRQDEKRRGYWFQNFRLRILTIDLFLVTPAFLVTGPAKLAGLTLGTDALVTVGFLCCVLFFIIATFDLTREEFNVFVNGAVNRTEAEKAKRFRDVLKVVGALMYAGVNGIPALWALTLDKSLGPMDNQEHIVIYLRNIGSIGFVGFDLFSTWMIRKRVLMIETSEGRQNDKALTAILKKLGCEMRSYMIFLSTMGIVYSIFSVPFFFQFQTYALAVLVGIGSQRHAGKALAEKSRIGESSELRTGDENGTRISKIRESHGQKLVDENGGTRSIRLAEGHLSAPRVVPSETDIVISNSNVSFEA